uniref:C-CAP/cofactor C-like domain-containing protein n=1 Tax=Ascaris lumbricoides TaxID=6252 RepID=A0A9J2Q2K9_ASCLU
MSLRLCCPKKRHADREEQYHVKEEEPPKERQRADPSHYQFAKLYGEVVAKLDGHVAGQQFVIDKCKTAYFTYQQQMERTVFQECCILVLDYTASVNIDDCEKCLIVLGPCKGRSVIPSSAGSEDAADLNRSLRNAIIPNQTLLNAAYFTYQQQMERTVFQECCILVLDYTASVNIDDCEKCLIVLGPCKGSVFVRDCVSCTIFTISQQFRSRDCSDIDVFIFCSTRPIIESCKLMRFRPLSLYYDKLEGSLRTLLYSSDSLLILLKKLTFKPHISEHMLKASVSPFTNNWNSIHDFTPEETSNFEICPMAYDTIENMELVNNLEKVKFTAELSFFPQYIPSDAVQQKIYLILCKEVSSESIEDFYRRAVAIQRELITAGAKIVATRDVLIRKGEMYTIFGSKQTNKYSGRIVSIEAACEMTVLEKICEGEGGAVELVSDENFVRYRTSLHRLADIQMEV